MPGGAPPVKKVTGNHALTEFTIDATFSHGLCLLLRVPSLPLSTVQLS
jgi:hypothetical protein